MLHYLLHMLLLSSEVTHRFHPHTQVLMRVIWMKYSKRLPVESDTVGCYMLPSTEIDINYFRLIGCIIRKTSGSLELEISYSSAVSVQ